MKLAEQVLLACEGVGPDQRPCVHLHGPGITETSVVSLAKLLLVGNDAIRISNTRVVSTHLKLPCLLTSVSDILSKRGELSRIRITSTLENLIALL